MRVLFVCSGNICRSPFAEVLARDLNDRADIEFASAGTIAFAGNHASVAGVAVAEEWGLDMGDHRATELTEAVLAASELVYAMEDEHLESVLALDPDAAVELLSTDGHAIPDPYGGGGDEYRRSYSLIREAIERRFAAPGRFGSSAGTT